MSQAAWLGGAAGMLLNSGKPRGLGQAFSALGKSCSADRLAILRGIAEQAQSQPASAADGDGEPSTADELALIKAALDKFIPDKAMQEAFRINEVSRLRLADLPATSEFMESFTGSKLPGQPLYDLPSWLEHSYPQYDTSPKSPFYSWTVWARDNLPREQQRLLHAFHAYMQDTRFRNALIRQAHFELARLWHWQHQRAAAGLPSELTPDEARRAAAASAAAAFAAGSSDSAQRGGAGAQAAAQAQPVAAAAPVEAPPVAKPEISSSGGPLKGILGIIKQADKKQKEVEAATRQQLAMQGLRDLTPEQRTLVSSLKAVDAELRQLSRDFESRVERGKEVLDRPGISRARDLLRSELETRTAAVVEATNSGQDYSKIERHVTLYNPAGDNLDAMPSGGGPAGPGKPLKKLYPSDLRQMLEGHSRWTETQLLDIRANQERAQAMGDELKREVQQLKEADDRLARHVQDHGYQFDLSLRPPTPTLDRLTQYLQVKYMDAVHQRDEAHALLSQLAPEHQQHHFPALLSHPVSPTAWSRLSPQEVQQLNDRATREFEEIGRTGSVGRYVALMRQLHSDGIVSEAELDESLAAARIRAAEARASLTPSTSASPAPPPTPESLLALLTEAGAGAGPGASRALLGASASERARAQQLWEEAAKGSFDAWSKSMVKHAEADIAARRAQGEAISFDQEKELLSWWVQPVPFSEAEDAWAAYLASAGMPHGPRLDEVLLADTELRKARASQPAAGAAPSAAGAEEEEGGKGQAGEASLLEERLREVFDAFSARHGSTVCSHAGTPGSTGDVSWGEVQARNVALDVTSPERLHATFQAPSLRQVLSQHWEATAQRLLQASGSAAKGTSSAAPKISSFGELWDLMLQVYDTTLASRPRPAGSTLPAPADAAPAPSSREAPHLGGEEMWLKKRTERRLSGVSAEVRAVEGWTEYVDSQTKRASSLDAPPTSPPYPGAKPILRFTQTFVLAPTPSTHTTSVATQGFGPESQPGSLDSHALNRGVELRVRYQDLQQEAGLSDEALQLILDVCGPERLDTKRREIVLKSDCYPAREENRRHVLDQMHRLLEEARAHTS